MTAPPRLATRLLRWRLHPDEHDELRGDLDEEFGRRLAADGPGAAARWYWRQTLSLTWGFFLDRRDVVSPAHERRRGAWMMHGLRHDWRDATRGLRRSPAFTLVALLTITCGIGLSTAVFSLVESVLLQPLPYRDAARLVRLSESRPQSPLAASGLGRPGVEDSGGSLADTTIGEWVSGGETLDAIVPMSTSGRNVATRTGAEQITVASVGVRFFDLMSTDPVAGRLLQAADAAPDAPAVVVVSERLAARLAPDVTSAVGASLRLDDEPFTIVGVSPALAFPEAQIDLWIPGRWRWPSPGARRNLSMSLDTIGRMKPGVTVDAVQREGDALVTRIASAHPNFFDGTVPIPTLRARRLQDDLVAPARPALVALGVGMGLVLLAACASLANLVLTRTAARRRESAVRLALGASRARLARPVLLEQIILSAAGSALGAVMAWWILRTLPVVAPADLPRLADVRFDAWSLLVATLAAAVTASVAGLAPIWRLGGRVPTTAANDLRNRAESRSSERLRGALVACQVGLAATLLVGAALVGRSLVALLQVDTGYRAEGVLTFQVSLPEFWWRQPDRLPAFVDALSTRLLAHPEVIAVGSTTGLPMRTAFSGGTFWIAGRPRPTNPAERPAARNRVVTPGYLTAVGTAVRRGRDFNVADLMDAERVVLIDEVVATRYFPGEDPIGRRLQAIGSREWTIVGIVSAVHDREFSAPSDPVLYFPAAQLGGILAFNTFSGGLAVRSTGDPAALAPIVRAHARELEPDWPIFRMEPLATQMAATMAEPRFYTVALGLFAALALGTAVLGVYGVLAYAVERRRLEFSVRRALGASEGQVLRLVIGRGLGLAAIGLAFGLTTAAAGGSLLRSQLFGIEPLDAMSFVAAAGLLTTVVLAASWWPARRATAVDPVEALRAD